MGAVRSWLWFEASKYSTGQDDQDGFWTSQGCLAPGPGWLE